MLVLKIRMCVTTLIHERQQINAFLHSTIIILIIEIIANIVIVIILSNHITLVNFTIVLPDI